MVGGFDRLAPHVAIASVRPFVVVVDQPGVEGVADRVAQGGQEPAGGPYGTAEPRHSLRDRIDSFAVDGSAAGTDGPSPGRVRKPPLALGGEA